MGIRDYWAQLGVLGGNVREIIVDALEHIGSDGSGEFTNVEADTVTFTDAGPIIDTTAGVLQLRLADNAGIAYTIRVGSGTPLFGVGTADNAEQVFLGNSGLAGSTVELRSLLLNTVGNGTAAGTGISVQERGDGNIHKSVFTLTAHEIATTDAGAAGAHGTTAFYTFPEGHIRILGAHANFTTLTAGSGGIADGAVLDLGVGQAAVGVGNDELSGTEADIILCDEVTLVAGAGSAAAVMAATPVAIDGSATAGTLNLNLAVDADDHGAGADTLAVTGTITIIWVHLGDD